MAQIQEKLEAKLEKDLIANAVFEKAKVEEARKIRVTGVQRDFQNALKNKQWATAQKLATQLRGDSFYFLARAMPNPTILFLERAIERTSTQLYKNDLAKMVSAAQEYYDSEVARHQRWQQQQNARGTFTGGGAVSSYQPSASPPKTMAQYMHDHAQAQRYKDASHKVNMGWYRPSGY